MCNYILVHKVNGRMVSEMIWGINQESNDIDLINTHTLTAFILCQLVSYDRYKEFSRGNKMVYALSKFKL